MTKKEALAQFLGKTTDEIRERQLKHCAPSVIFTLGREEYYVLTDEEADKEVADKIEDDLWAFKSEFLENYFPEGVRAEHVRKAQEELCENAQPLIHALVGDRLPKLIQDAVDADGRGHFLASYDGEENECPLSL